MTLFLTCPITGCEFSAAQELLVVAIGEGSSIREWWDQKNAQDSGAQPDTQQRGSQDFLAWNLLLPCVGMEQLCPLTSSSELDLQNSQPVICVGLSSPASAAASRRHRGPAKSSIDLPAAPLRLRRRDTNTQTDECVPHGSRDTSARP